jgi:uncharacterized protein (AIM24 family)
MTQTPGATYVCPYCRLTLDLSGEPGGTSCPACGAAFDVRRVVSPAGWVKQPAIQDMARLKIGTSSAQISGTYVPVTEFDLHPDDSIYFSHHVLLHVDPSVRLANLPLDGAFSRMRAGLPIFMLTAAGPGRIALSYDHPGETIAVPLPARSAIDVTEHRLLAATGSVRWDYLPSGVYIETVQQTSDGTEREWSYPVGQYVDRFHTPDGPGLLLLHARGNVMTRDLAAGEEIMVQPDSLVYKDTTVSMSLHFEYPGGGFAWRNRLNMHQWLRLVGPGRIAIASVFETPEPLQGRIARASYYTVQQW